MAAKKTWTVLLNSGAMGVQTGESTREIEAERMEYDANSNRVVFYNGEDVVAFYQHALGVEPTPKKS